MFRVVMGADLLNYGVDAVKKLNREISLNSDEFDSLEGAIKAATEEVNHAKE